MSLSDSLLAVLTVLTSLALVIVIIAAAWWLMWKLFLSRFQFINEILFPPSDEEAKQKSVSRRKARKD